MKKKKHPQMGMGEPSSLTLYLIREELKSRKFFSGLQKLGLDYCFYQPHLDKPILAAIGFDDPSDEVYNSYFRLIEKRSRKISEDQDSITKQARKVYRKLRSGKFYHTADEDCASVRLPQSRGDAKKR